MWLLHLKVTNVAVNHHDYNISLKNVTNTYFPRVKYICTESSKYCTHTSVCIQISIDLNSSNKPNDLCIAVPSSYVHVPHDTGV